MIYLLIVIIGALFIGLSIIVSRKIKQVLEKKNNSVVSAEVIDEKAINKFSSIFVNASEEYISSLGNGYILNYLANNTVKKGFSIVTDKRVYFRGSCFTGNGKNLHKSDEQRTVDLNDVTGSGFIYTRYFGILLALVAAIASLITGIIVLCNFNVESLNTYYDHKEKIEILEEEIAFYYTIDEANIAEIYKHLCKERDLLEDFLYDEESENDFPADLPTEIKGDRKKMKKELRKYENRIEFIEEVDDLSKKLDKQDEKIAELRKYKNSRFRDSLLYSILTGLIFPFLATSVLVFLEYLKKRKTYFEIQYAGGRIAFDVSFYAIAEIEDFQRELRRAKDLYVETNSKTQVEKGVYKAEKEEVREILYANPTDELRKYAKLLEEGLISDEDYEVVKKRVLGL